MTPEFERAIHGFLNSRGRKILKEIIVTMCAGDPLVLTRVRLQRVILRTEKYVATLPVFYFLLFKIALYMLQYALPPLSWKLIPFTRMPLERRLRYFDEWQSSNFYFKRVIFKMITAVCVSHLYSERRLLMSLGFESSMRHRMANQASALLDEADGDLGGASGDSYS